MKKIITSFMVLFFLIGVGTKSYGQAAGDYVFTQATDNLWATVGNWSISDGAGNLTAATRTPAATDNVWIQATKVMSTVGATISGTAAFTAGSPTITLAASNANIAVGMAIRNKSVTGANYGFTPGTYVTAVNGTSVTLSKPVTLNSSAVSLEFYPACKNLIVNGSFTVSTQFVVFGDVTVNTGGILSQSSDLYCANINNYGTFNANAGYRSGKNLYLGYIGATPGAGDYTIINDGTFGDTAPKVPQGTTGGINLIYSNQANSVTIKASSPLVSTYAFNIGQLLPTSIIKTLANTTLNIKQSMSLLKSSGINLSVQNNDSSENTIRTCNIDPGVTVYLGCNFHANRGVITSPQGNVTYNVNGTLDLGTNASVNNNLTPQASQTTAFSLCMASNAGNTGTLTFNLGDGTQANAGTLILGSYVQLIKQSTQTIGVNFKDYSTVKFTGNYGWQVYYQLMNSGVPALYLFPKNYFNLTIDGAGVILPVKPNVKGTYSYANGGYGSTKSNWSGSASPKAYSGTIYAIPGNVVNTGSAYYYAPLFNAKGSYIGSTVAPNPVFTSTSLTLVNDTAFQFLKSGQVINGTGISNDTIVSIAGNVVTIKNGVSTSVTTISNGILTIKGLQGQGTTAPTGTSTNPYNPVFDGCQGLIYLGASDLQGYNSITDVKNPSSSKELIYSTERNKLVIANATVGDIASVYSISGIKVASAKLTSDKTTVSIASGIYLVKVNASVSKVIVR